MKKLAVILFLFAACPAHAQISVIVVLSAQFGLSGGTTTTVTTTGSDGLFVALTYHTTGGPNISDNKANTWILDGQYEVSPTASAGVAIYHCQAPCVVGTGHTFSTSSRFCGVNVLGASGTRTISSPFDQKNGNTGGSGTTVTPGSITTTFAGAIVITAVCNFNGTQPTIPSGYSSMGTYPTATAEAGGAAYKILSGTGSENGSWGNMTAGNPQSCMQADYLPPATAPVANPRELIGQLY